MTALLLLACGSSDPSPADATADTGPVVYEASWDGVQQLFEDHCDSCHPATNNLDLRADIDAYATPGDPDASALWVAVSGMSISTMMPPSGTLPPESIAHVEAWILDGAVRP